MCEHSQMLAFIGKATFGQPEPVPVVKTRPVLRTWCRNCGHAAVECVGHEDCGHFTPEEYAASAAEQVEGLDPIPPGHPAYEEPTGAASPW